MPFTRGPYATLLVDRLRERIPSLEHHPDAPPERHRIHVPTVDVDVVEDDRPLVTHAGQQRVHPVDRSQERRLATPGRTDERRDTSRHRVHRNAVQGLLLAVPERELRRRSPLRGPSAHPTRRRLLQSRSSESSSDVRFGARVAGRREYRARRAILDQLAGEHECRAVGDARCLLHVVRHDDDRDLLAELVHQLFDPLRAEWVERRRRLVEQGSRWATSPARARYRDAAAVRRTARPRSRQVDRAPRPRARRAAGRARRCRPSRAATDASRAAES